MKENRVLKGLGSTATLWHFDKLKGSKNYKSWCRNITNVLKTNEWFYICTQSAPTPPLKINIVIEDDEITKTRKTSVVIKSEHAIWEKIYKTYLIHSRAAKSYIYNKCGDIAQNLMKNIEGIFEIWNLLKNQYSNQDFIFKHIIFQRLCTTTLDSCDNDIDKFVVTLQRLQRDLRNMNHLIDDWIVCSNLLTNLNERFSDYVFRTVTIKKLSSFQQMTSDLQELDRMKKRDIQVLTLRAQTTEDQIKGKESKNISKIKCIDCGDDHSDFCFLTHSELKEKYEVNKKKKREKAKKQKKQKKKKEKKKKEKKKKAEKKTKKEATKIESSTNNYAFSFGHMINSIMILDLYKNSTFDSSTNSSFDAVFLITYSDWFVDSSCTKHMTPNRDDFIEYHELNTTHDVFVANDVIISTIDKRIVRLKSMLSDEKITTVELKEVLHVPQLSSELLFTSQIIMQKDKVVFDDKKCFIRQKAFNLLILHAFKCRNQYPLNLMRTKDHIAERSAAFYTKYNEIAVQLWHRRLRHLNRQNLIRLQNMSTDMKLKNVFRQKITRSLCESCKRDKMKAKSSRRSQDSMFEKNECIDTDLCESINSSALKGYTYFCINTDKAIDYSWIYLFHTKNEFLNVMKRHFLPMMKTQTPTYKIKRWKTDWETEFVNKLVKAEFDKKSINWELSVFYAKQQNDDSKRNNVIIMNAVRTIIIDSELSISLWDEIMKTIIKLKNIDSVARFRIQHMISYEAYHGVKSDISHYRMLRCDAWHAVSKKIREQKKLSDKSIKCKLIDYESINQYRLWNPSSRRIFVFKNVEFDESYMLTYLNKAFHWDDDFELSIAEDFVSSENDSDYA